MSDIVSDAAAKKLQEDYEFLTFEQYESLRKQLAEKDAEIDRLKRCDFSHERVQNDSYKLANKVLHEQLTASQAYAQQLRRVLQEVKDSGYTKLSPRCYMIIDEALFIPYYTTALEAMIQKAGEVMRERCAEYMLLERKAFEQNKAVWDTSPEFRPDESYIETWEDRARDGEFDAEAIRALPGIKLEDLNK